VLYFDANEYKIAPGTIVGCAVLNQEKAAYERVKAAIQGKLAFGKAEIVSAKDGYVDFADADPLYTSNVPEAVRKQMAEVVKDPRRSDQHGCRSSRPAGACATAGGPLPPRMFLEGPCRSDSRGNSLRGTPRSPPSAALRRTCSWTSAS
jgi:hypothetical protein